MRTSRTRSTLVALGAGVLLTACAGSPADDAVGVAELESLGLDEAGLEHVHGLAVDPTDGGLYAASHFGVFRLPASGDAERIADRQQDTMGFTITDDGTFLGSGHPDFGLDPDLPPLLGLISSDDRAVSWQPVSLQGRADALQAAGDVLYGYDATGAALMVSTDGGATWQSRGGPPVRDLAVDPADVDVVIATTQTGPAASRDQGRTFAPLRGAPDLLVLSWSGPGLFGADTTGQVHASTDSGATWQPRGKLDGEPQAFYAADDGALYAAIDDAVLTSADGGMTWTVRYQE